MLNEEKLKKTIKIISVPAILFCCILLFPQVRNFIVEITGRALGWDLNRDKWTGLILNYSLLAILCFGVILISLVKNVQNYLEKNREYGEKIFVYASIGIVVISIIVIIVMYVKGRSLWADEAMLARSIVSRNWFELLVPPLDDDQSAPVLYVIAVKLIGSIFDYSEFSLRIFSLLTLIGLLICEKIFLKKVLNYSNYQTAFVIVVSALLPAYIWYSNELKPYVSDAFFVVLSILLQFYFTQGKLKLSALTVLYILILGFSTPTIFFIGGILLSEFLSAAFNKNKKSLLFIFLSGIIVLAVFCLYYYWWMLPVLEPMKAFWSRSKNILEGISKIIRIFSPMGNSDSSFVMFFVPFALLGIFSLIKSKNKIAYSVALSLFFIFLASLIGYWPMTARLWLFLPAIVLIFTPIGTDIIHDKIKNRKITGTMEFSFFSVIVIFLLINCLGYIGDKTYYKTQEINPLIYYVQGNIKEDEKLYVYPNAIPAFEFKNGYTTTKIGNVDNDNIIFGINGNEWSENSLGNELLTILENEKTYLIFQHYGDIDRGIAVLRNYGTLTEVMNVHDTPLYYFKRNFSNE